MPAPELALHDRFQSAFAAAFGEEHRHADPIIRPSQFADFQCNAAMGLAKKLGMTPRDVAQQILDHVDLGGVAEVPEIAGPGFLNIRLETAWVATQAAELSADSRLGVPVPETPQTVVVDYSAPNVAKEMHVGHLRTTVIGDSIVRSLEKLGHTVVRQNHIGDWGTPFGMLIEHLLEVGEGSEESKLLETDPNAFYQAARKKFDAADASGPAPDGSDFASRARRRVATLQSGDGSTLAIWSRLVDLSKEYFHRVYDLLDITLTDEDLAGESTYNADLEIVAKELEADGLARISDGALCVFPEGFIGRDEKPLPLIVRKTDGGFGYATTDLAAVRRRVRELHADRIAYVVGTPQELHFSMVWSVAREAGWIPEDVQVTHVKVGSVLGEDGKILKTRSGQSLRLMALLGEAVDAARGVIDELRPDLPEAEREEIARTVGIGGVKYADLSTSHDTDYTFDLDRMLALTGNTAPYLQYAVARIRSISRKAQAQGIAAADAPRVQNDAERALALRLLDYGQVLTQVGEVYEPHRLAAYLFSLAQDFTAFYDASPILKESDEAARSGRLALAQLTEKVLVDGLDALGISAPQQM